MKPDEDTAVLVLSHEDRFDIPALKGALETDAFYVGAWARAATRSAGASGSSEEGVGEEDIDRIAGPSRPRHRALTRRPRPPYRSSRRSSPAAPGAPAARSRTARVTSTPSSSQDSPVANVLCVLYDDPVDGYPPAYARDGVPTIERYHGGQTTPTPEAIDFTPGELLGSVSGELGLRTFLEGAGPQADRHVRQGRARLGLRARAARMPRSSSRSRSGPPT